MEVPTFWVEECTYKIPKGDASNPYKLGFFHDDIVMFGSTMEKYGHHLKMCLNNWGHMGWNYA